MALLKAYGIKQVVLSPGSRNAPLIQAFTQEPFFDCHLIVDERNAAFYALGIIQCKQEPVVICCTSGTAALDYAPAVAEAYYQQLPLIVLSADRAAEWIDQMDGQTIRQADVYRNYIQQSVNLPEGKDSSEEWHCNRLVNEALIACIAHSAPVHINIPLSEPLFDYSVGKLPEVRKINYSKPTKEVDIQPFADIWNTATKKMIVIGQLLPDAEIREILKVLAEKCGCVILSEHLANCNEAEFIHNFDTILREPDAELAPELLITFSGHMVSKRLKKFIREHKPAHHWHLAKGEKVMDLYQSLTDLIETDAKAFLSELPIGKSGANNTYKEHWNTLSQSMRADFSDIPFSDIYACGKLINQLPNGVKLLLANSSPLRNIQYFDLDPSVEIYCNRGTNGIEGSLPTAIGFASVCKQTVYYITGDLSFFCAVNALWNITHIKNLRILLLNNQGGNIFHGISGLNKSASLPNYVAAAHDTTARKWVEAARFNYLHASNKEELDKHLSSFMDETTQASIVLEVSTDIAVNQSIINEYKL
ncbi:2-succinyl-5-enolpyruvyl-6-hydroxy-3-cyclohexene-1-carboxylic-acid synthase [Dysgonomonas sp. 25]|uniref:2-succinyl-5-enolpyruvyl-6-hydroxy-3- cyclohexene-1-carboxylic-acid synthase n=1 Tax=Dysgonomonas sp. 25 TaxID=2302933 RepID=UPI0013D4C87B